MIENPTEVRRLLDEIEEAINGEFFGVSERFAAQNAVEGLRDELMVD